MAEHHLQMLAPHMIVGLSGPGLSDEEKTLLSDYRFPGVILFDRNVRNVRQLMELTCEIRRIFREAGERVPVIAADHEGGVISVLARAIGAPPTQMAAARTGDPRCCERLFAENARRLRACGVNMLLGPVADINFEYRNPVIGTRSFGEDAELVSSLVSAAVSAARKEGVLTCIKHFPGHGASRVDSHLALPVLDATLAQLKEKDILPFASGIKAGAETVMVGHISPLDRSLPASLDPEIMGGLLRKELGFEGVVMTDALEMEGVKMAGPRAEDAAGGARGEEKKPAGRIEPAKRPLPEICKLALAAGNDILLFSKPVAEVIGELASFVESAADDEFWGQAFPGFEQASTARIEKLLRIAAEKDREFELPNDPGIYAEIAEKSIRVIQKPDTASSLEPGSGLEAVCDSEKDFTAVFYSEKGELDRFPAQSFITRVLQDVGAFGDKGQGAEASGRFGEYSLEQYGSVPGSAAHLEALLFSAGKSGAKIDTVFLLNRRPLSQEAIGEICSGAEIVVVAGWPYAARFIPFGPRFHRLRRVIVTYGIYDAAADAVRRNLR